MKYKIRLIVTVVFICLLSLSAFSQTRRKTIVAPCAKFIIQAEVTECADREYKKADSEMNRIYQLLLTSLAEGSDAEDDQQKLKGAQARWLEYRDAECESEASIYEGGTRRPAAYSLCLAAVTRERTNRLKAFLNETKQ